MRWWQPVAASALAAGVAAAAILWLRAESPTGGTPLSASAQLASPAASSAAVMPASASGSVGRAESYVVPPSPALRPAVVPSTELANYVVAHSMYSSPVARRNLLSAFMTSEPTAGAEEPQDDAKSTAP